MLQTALQVGIRIVSIDGLVDTCDASCAVVVAAKVPSTTVGKEWKRMEGKGGGGHICAQK